MTARRAGQGAIVLLCSVAMALVPVVGALAAWSLQAFGVVHHLVEAGLRDA